MQAISAVNIHKSYGEVEVLKGIDLEIQKGEIVSIIGASGAGKTTLLQILGTLDRPDKGQVLIGGQQVSGFNDAALSKLRNQKIGFVFQFHHLLPEFTALENVMMPALIARTSAKASQKRAVELLSYFNLSERFEHKPGMLSGGEQQRVAVARALMNRPEIILADEPSGNLDSANARELHSLFFKLREDLGQTFLIVTHNPDLAAMSDRTIEMKDGRIAG
jgi:lipoprotein-releasing system ATP-binding protein